MPVANGLALPNPISNGTTNDAVPVMADFNYLLAALNRALLDAGGGAGMNAQATQIHNLANGTAANDAVNLSQLNGYALLAGSTFTGPVSITSTLGVTGATSLAAITASGLITGNAGAVITALTPTSRAVILNGGLTGAGGGSSALLVISDPLNNLGAGILFTGDGTHPSKILRAHSGALQVVNDANTAVIFQLDDASNLSMLNAVSATTLSTTNLVASGPLTPGSVANCPGFLGIPAVTKTANYQLAIADAGTAINMNGAGLTLTIPANASTAIPVDSVILVTNLNASNLSIAITTDTLTLSGTTTTGTRTLGPNGEARLRKVSATSWLIAGTALS
jgi:hypothetical protein